MLNTYKEKNYPPDIELVGLRIWIDGRKYPDHYDFCDGNWLNITVHCSSDRSSAWFSGDILRNEDIAQWLNSLEKLNESVIANTTAEVLSGEANFNPTERYFTVKIKLRTYQRISINIDIFPNDYAERHYYEFWLDQNYLKHLIENCRTILKKFPIIGNLRESTYL